VAVQDVRGRHGSGGRFEPFVDEPSDGAATARWLAEQPWCDGRIGTYGYSYCGTIQPATAAAAEGAIAAVAPGFHSADLRGEWAFPGGALALAFLLSWSIELGIGDARRSGEAGRLGKLERAWGEMRRLYRTLPLDAIGGELGLGATPWGEWLSRRDDDPFWERYRPLSAAPETPALHHGGWYDVFARGTVAGYRRSPGPRRLLMGPWLHAPWSWSERASGRVVDDELVAWFRCHLRDEDPPDGPAVRVFALGREEWLAFESWPPPECGETRLELGSGGRANTCYGDGWLAPEPGPRGAGADSFVSDPAAPAPAPGGHSCCDPALVPAGPADQAAAERSPAVLVYTTPPLEAPALIAGPVRLELSAATSAPRSLLAATLCLLGRDGRSVNLLEGVGHVEGGGDPRPCSIDLCEVCAEIATGERLRRDVSGCRIPQWERCLNRAGLGPGRGTLADALVARNEVAHRDGARSVLVLPLGWPADRPGWG
jgi:putative CocE/NonD family hydrolase